MCVRRCLATGRMVAVCILGIGVASLALSEDAEEAAKPKQGPEPAERQFVKHKLLEFSGEEVEEEFLELAGARQRTRDDMTVIARLVREKQAEISRFDEALQEDFGVEPGANYHYQAETKTIFRLESQEGEEETESPAPVDPVAAGVTNSFQRTLHRTLDDEDLNARFLRLLAAKQLSSQQVRALRLLHQEKEIEMAALQQSLLDRFSISSDRQYEYNRETRELYELVPMPRGFDVDVNTPD